MIENLIKFQEQDTKLHDIEVELAQSESRKKVVQAKAYLASVEENVAKLDLRASELANAYENACAQLERLKEQQAEFSNAMKDASDEGAINYLIKKIEELMANIKAISQEANRLAEESTKTLQDYSTIVKKTKLAKAQYDEQYKEYSELKASKTEEIKTINAELDKIKGGIDPALMERYMKKRNEKIFPILFPLRGEVCGACNMGLSMAEIAKLKNGEILECENCRHLIYKGEE